MRYLAAPLPDGEAETRGPAQSRRNTSDKNARRSRRSSTGSGSPAPSRLGVGEDVLISLDGETRALDGVLLVSQERLDPPDDLDVVLGVGAVAGSILLRLEDLELRLPIPEHVGLEAGHLTDLADRVVQLTDPRRRHGERVWLGDATDSGWSGGYVLPPPKHLVTRNASELALLAVILVWGVNFAVIKVPLEVAPPFTVNLLRFTVSLAVLAALHARDTRRRGRRFAATFEVGWRSVVGVGLLGVLVYQLTFILGIDRVSAGTAALLMATSPAWTSVGSHLLKQERLLPAGWTGIGLSLAGVGLVVAGNPGAAFDGGGFGVVLMLVAALAWGLYTTLSRPLLDRGASALGLSFWGVLLSYPGLVLLALPEQSGMKWSALGPLEIGALLFSGGLSTGLAYAIWNQSISAVGASRTAAFSNLVPVTGVVAGIVLRGESVTLPQILGGALVIAGVVLVRRRGIGPVVPSTPRA